MSVSYIDRQAIAAIAPQILERFALTRTQFGWLGSAFAVTYLVFAPIAGWAVDRWGPKWVLAAAVVAWSVVSGAHALAGSFVAFLALRLLLGMTESPAFPAAAKTMREGLLPNERSLGFGLLFTGSSIGAMIAAPLAPMLARVSLGFAFVGTAAVALVWLPFWMWLAPTSSGARPSAEVAPPIEPVMRTGARRAVWTHPAMGRQMLMVLVSAPAITFVLQWLPQHLVLSAKIDKSQVGHFVWLPPLVFDVAAVTFGALSSRAERRARSGALLGARHEVARGARLALTPRWLMMLGAGLVGALALLPFVHGPWAQTLCASCAMAGGAGMYVVGTADLMRRLDGVATAGGISASVQSIVQIAVNPAIGYAGDHMGTFAWAALGLGVLALPGAWLWLMLEPREVSVEPLHERAARSTDSS
jgi:ACS family hexuronate transporter-like MFS transporter